MQQNFDWIMKIILSCSNSFHIQCCVILCDRFKAMYDDTELHTKLLTAMSEQESKWAVTV